MQNKLLRNKPQKAAPVSRRLPRKAVIAIILLATLLAITFTLLGYRSHADRQRQERARQADEAAFASVEREMAQTYGDIVAAAGKPDVSKKSKSCSYIAHKYDKGKPHCSVVYDMSYGDTDIHSSLSRTKLLEAAISKSHVFIPESEESIVDRIRADDNGDQSAVKIYDEMAGISCSLRYDYQYAINNKPAANNPYLTVYTYDCDEEVNEPVYPLAE